MKNKERSGKAARSLMMSEYQGILSTLSVEAQGYSVRLGDTLLF